MIRPKVLLFDVFNTLLDMSDIPREEISAYVQHVREFPLEPLQLPESWSKLRAFHDVAHGLTLLRTWAPVVAFSNCPLPLMVSLARRNGIRFDAIIPLELPRTYKPHPFAYQVPRILWPNLEPSDLMVITANPTFGDVEGAESVGMRSQIIRQPGYPADLHELDRLFEKGSDT
jgi:FMN phosphatase YigB (HAD superfamily)